MPKTIRSFVNFFHPRCTLGTTERSHGTISASNRKPCWRSCRNTANQGKNAVALTKSDENDQQETHPFSEKLLVKEIPPA